MKMSVIVFFSLSLCLCLLPFSSVSASEIYTIGVGDYDYYPHHRYANREYTGFAREVLDLFAAKHKMTFLYRALPWKRVVSENVKGGLDFVFPDNPHWDTDKKNGIKVHYSNPAVQYIDGVMVLPENMDKRVEELKSLGTVMGFTAWIYRDRISSGQIRLDESYHYASLLKMVLLKRIDGAYTEISVAKYVLREDIGKPDALIFNFGLPHTKDFYHLSSIKHPNILKEFDKFLDTEKKQC